MFKTVKAFYFISAFFLLFSYSSCVMTGSRSKTDSKDMAGKNTVLKIKKPYSNINFKKTLVQFHESLESFDYFNQFTWGDYVFEDYLTTIFGLEKSFYKEGCGSEISVYDNTGKVSQKIRRSLLEINNKDEAWWQIEHIGDNGEKIFYEVLTNRFFVPVTVRFKNKETGKGFSRDTMFGESIKDLMLNMRDSEIRKKLNKERTEEALKKFPLIYTNLKNTGFETIEAGGRKIEAVHYQSYLSAEKGTLDVWYTPEIPFGLVRIMMNKKTVAEITGWIDGAERKIKDASTALF